MPITVPQVQSQVRDQPFQAPRLRPTAGEESFGGGADVNRAFQAAGAFGSDVQKFALEEKLKADKIVAFDADKKLSEIEINLTYGDNGIRKRLGKDAFASIEETPRLFKEEADKIEKSLSNDNQKLEFKRNYESRLASLNRTAASHAYEQGKKYEDQTYASYIDNERNAAMMAYEDQSRISESLERQRNAIISFSQANGMPAEYTKQKLREVESKTHIGVIEQMLNNNLDIIGKNYYDANKDKIDPEDSKSIQRALEEGTLRGESQRFADSILAKTNDRQMALEEAQKIPDPKLREETEQRINKRISENLQAQRERQDQLYLDATNIMDKSTGGTASARDLIPVSMWTKLSNEQRNALQRRREDGPNDDRRWLDFRDLARDPSAMAKMSRAEFETKYWSRFDKEHKTRAESLWDSAKSGGEDPKLSTTTSFDDRVDYSLSKAGLVRPNKKTSQLNENEVKTKAEFVRQAAKAVSEYEISVLGGKRKTTPEEQQKIIDDLTVNKVFIEKRFARDPQKPVSILTDEEKAHTYVPIEQIPEPEINAIENLARSKSVRLTKEKTQRLYAAYLERDRNKIDSILAEK